MRLMGLYLKLVGLMGKDMCLIEPPMAMDGLPHLSLPSSACLSVLLPKKMEKIKLPLMVKGQ